jgi:hypothetical protein
MIRTNSALQYLVILAAAALGAGQAKADVVKFNGVLNSDGSAVGSGDPVITNPATINVGDPFSILLNYDPTSFTLSGGSYVLTNATFTLTFDGYSFPYASTAGNYIEFSTPGAYGSGTTSFLICSSLPGCFTNDFVDLYFKGSVSNPSTLEAQASGLSGDASASPSEFEFLRNFDDGSQTDLQGTLGTPNPTPEPSTLALLAMATLWVCGAHARMQRKRSGHDSEI